jgi:hypothetical protein
MMSQGSAHGRFTRAVKQRNRYGAEMALARLVASSVVARNVSRLF